MIFCALNQDQHKSLYKLIYKNISDSQTFDLKNYSIELYNKILKATNNYDLALTYVSYIPSYVSNLQTEDKDFRKILKDSKTDANELLDKIDEWENQLQNVQSYLGVSDQSTPITASAEEAGIQSKEEAKQTTDEAIQRVATRNDVENIMQTAFNLNPQQSYAVASIYDRVGKTYAERNNTTPQAFYESISFRNGLGNESVNPLYQEAISKISKEKTVIKKESQKNGTFLKAPNGKPSLLNEDQWLTTRTPTFKKWFGDWENDSANSSKIVDENGEPLLVYHTSYAKFDEFRKDKISKYERWGAEDGIINKMKWLFKKPSSFGFFFTKYFEYVNFPDKNVYSVFLDIKNPLIAGEREEEKFWSSIKTKDFDGAIWNDKLEIIAYEPNQIKSAEGINETFSDDPNIYYQDNEISKVVKGFDLTYDPKAFGTAFRTKIGKATPELADRINEWTKTNGIDGVKFIYEKTYGTINAIPTSSQLPLFQRQNTTARAAVQIAEDGQAIIYALTNPNVSSPLHELAHVWEHQLNDTERKVVLDWQGQETPWNRNTSEAFARGFEAYLAEGEASNFSLQAIFDQFKQWLTDIYRGIFGTEIDVNLNDQMRKVYSGMLGTNFKEKTLVELQKEQDTRTEAQKILDQYNKNESLSSDITTPIPLDSATYWSHLSNIQQAFITKQYDKLLNENKINEEALRKIIESTKSAENEGLASDLVDQAIFRVNNPELLTDSDYWKNIPTKDSAEYPFYVRTIREIATNGDLIKAIQNDIISPTQARNILAVTAQIAPQAEQVAKDKEKELKERSKQTDEIIKNDPNAENIQKIMTATQKAAADTGLKDAYTTAILSSSNEEDFLNVMQELAQQASDKGTEATTRIQFGDIITDNALKLFPNEDTEDLFTKYNLLTDAEVAVLPEAIGTNPISEGDIVDFKGNRLAVEEVINTGDESMYALSDGSMKFASQITKIMTADENNIDRYNQITPQAFRDIEDELISDNPDKEKTLDYLGLKTVLDRLNTKFNNVLKYEIVSSSDNFKGKIENGIIKINLRTYDRTTPFHEFLHPFIEVLKVDNSELYINLVKEFAATEESKKIINELKENPIYNAGTLEEIGDEALIRYISTKAAENINSQGRRLESKYKSAFRRALDRFNDWFSATIRKVFGEKQRRNPNTVSTISDLSFIPTTATIEDITDIISLTDTAIDLSQRKEVWDSITKFQDDIAPEAKSLETKMIERIQKKIKQLENVARTGNNEILLKDVITYRKALKNPNELESLSSFMYTGFASIDQASSDFTGIKNKLFTAQGNLSEGDLITLNKELEVIKNTMLMAQEAIEYYDSASHLFRDEKDYFNEVIRKKEKVLGDMQATSINLTAEWLYPILERFNKKMADKPEYIITKEKLKNSLYAANQDIDQAFFLLGSVSSSKDVFSAIMRHAIFSKIEENHIFETELTTGIKIAYDKFLRDNNLENSRKATNQFYKDNYLRKATVQQYDGKDENGDPKYKERKAWAFIQEYNYDQFDLDRTKFMQNAAIFGEAGFDDTNQEHINLLFNWENENGNRIEVGTKNDFKDIYNAEGEKTGQEWVEVPVMKLVPNENYRNADYDKIKNDLFYQKLILEYNIANEKLGEQQLRFGIVPQVNKKKSAFADFKDKSVKEGAVLAASNLGQFFFAPITEESETSQLDENLDGTLNRMVGGYKTTLLSDEELDLTLPETVAKFGSMANLNNLKQEINPLIKTAKSLLEDNPKLKMEARKIAQTTAQGRTVFDRILNRPANKEKATTRLNQQLNEFINDSMYGETSLQQNLNIFGKSIDLNKLAGNWSFLTALNNMAFNINGGITNYMMGKTQEFIEATGGKFFNLKDLAKAQSIYDRNLGNIFKDGFNLRKSLVTQLGIKYDAIQGEFRDKFGKRFVGNFAERYASTDTLFIINHAAEHEIQLTGMLALMQATKVTNTDGTQTNLYDAHYIDEKGFLKLKDNIQWSKEDDLDFTTRWHAINKRLNGNYSSFDKATMQRRWYGKLALIYRKFIYTSIRSRFTKEYMDYELGSNDFGYQRKFFGKLASDIKQYKFDIAKYKKSNWSDDERYAAAKTITELSTFAAVTVLTLALAAGSYGDKKDTDWGKKAILLYLTRYQQDLQMFTVLGVKDVVKMLQNPSAIMVTMSKYVKIFQDLAHPGDTYTKKTGPFEKGSLKLKADLLKAIPILRQIVNFSDPVDQLAYYNVLSQKR